MGASSSCCKDVSATEPNYKPDANTAFPDRRKKFNFTCDKCNKVKIGAVAPTFLNCRHKVCFDCFDEEGIVPTDFTEEKETMLKCPVCFREGFVGFLSAIQQKSFVCGLCFEDKYVKETHNVFLKVNNDECLEKCDLFMCDTCVEKFRHYNTFYTEEIINGDKVSKFKCPACRNTSGRLKEFTDINQITDHLKKFPQTDDSKGSPYVEGSPALEKIREFKEEVEPVPFPDLSETLPGQVNHFYIL